MGYRIVGSGTPRLTDWERRVAELSDMPSEEEGLWELEAARSRVSERRGTCRTHCGER